MKLTDKKIKSLSCEDIENFCLKKCYYEEDTKNHVNTNINIYYKDYRLSDLLEKMYSCLKSNKLKKSKVPKYEEIIKNKKYNSASVMLFFYYSAILFK